MKYFWFIDLNRTVHTLQLFEVQISKLSYFIRKKQGLGALSKIDWAHRSLFIFCQSTRSVQNERRSILRSFSESIDERGRERVSFWDVFHVRGKKILELRISARFLQKKKNFPLLDEVWT